jgi:hypothetical protein
MGVPFRLHTLGFTFLFCGQQEPMIDPVVAADGHTYERAAIEVWLASHDNSPMTNVRLPNKTVSGQGISV